MKMRLGWLALLAATQAAAQLVHSNYTDTQSMLWGAYRPNLYFGVRPRIPQSLMTGLMWYGTQDHQGSRYVRHSCDQNDGLETYTWTEYDVREGGVQVLKDGKNNVKLTTEFLKIPGGRHGGSWAARIKGEPIDPVKPLKLSTIFYLGLEGMGGIDMDTAGDENGIEGTIQFTGSSPELDEFTIWIEDASFNTPVTSGPHSASFHKRLGKTHFLGRKVPNNNMWQAKEVIMQDIILRANDILKPYVANPKDGYPEPSFFLQMSNDVHTDSNLYAVQKLFEGEFQFDVFFESASAKRELSSSDLDQGIPALISSYNNRFESTFPVPSSYLPGTSDRHALEQFSKAITANLMGGVGYFYGTSVIDRHFAFEWDEDESDVEEDAEKKKSKGGEYTEPKALLTATPSRSFFPRGFYWDEGFHLLQIGQWDTDFSLEILKDWINLIDEDGWVAREQILGEEARSAVPAEFVTQVPNFANPPTLTMAVTAFIARARGASNGLSDRDLGLDMGLGSQIPLSGESTTSRYLESPELASEFLKSIYQPLKRHYDWFRRTQRGQIKQYARKSRSRSEAYRWRGRSAQHVLTSGMDDYPRGPPHAGELHLDLISWMAFFSRTMRDIAEFVGQVDDAASFRQNERAILDNIEDLHWNEGEQMYCDANVDDEDESYHVCHRGYLSLFPFLLSLLPPSSPHLGPILDLLRDPAHLWSPYGLRSLSASHELFGQGENYWRGPIWIQMNYLALSALHETYAKEDGPFKARAQEIYDELRRNVIDNVFKEYERTGYVWEQYDAVTGVGKRSHPFTGWTSLVTLILSEKYQ